jgi:uncharacterized protein (DUF1501 family)
MNAFTSGQYSRRQFIHSVGRGLAVSALSGYVPRLMAGGSNAGGNDAEPRALVLIQLEGGNDGFNTIVPFYDDHYYRLRPTLSIPRRDLVMLNETVALNRTAQALEPLFAEGKLAVVQNVGSAPQSQSHFRSSEIWHTGSEPGEIVYSGWLGRGFSTRRLESRAVACYHGSAAVPRVFATEPGRQGRTISVSLTRSGEDPGHLFAEVGERAALSAATEIYFVSVPGFDTHFDQARVHAARLRGLSEALSALQKRLERRGVDGRVVTMAFSEFGRSLAENRQGGTDHGDGSPVFLMGTPVAGGLYPERLEPTTVMDFRRVLSSLAADWLRVPAPVIFGRAFERLPFLRSSYAI